MNEEFIGIDVSKDSLDIATYYGKKEWHLTNDDTGTAELVAILGNIKPSLVVMESTGGYETSAAYALDRSGVPCAVVNPRETRDFARATKKLAKTDRIDAKVLAHFAAAIRPEPRPMSDEQAQELEAIISRRRQVVEMLTAEKNRLHMAQKAVREEIRAHINYLEDQLKRTDSDLQGRIEESPVQREKYRSCLPFP